jgi:hypothetical protein
MGKRGLNSNSEDCDLDDDEEDVRYLVVIHVGHLSGQFEALEVEASKGTNSSYDFGFYRLAKSAPSQ